MAFTQGLLQILGAHHREIHPVSSLMGGKIWPVVVVREVFDKCIPSQLLQRDLYFIVIPVGSAQATPEVKAFHLGRHWS